MLQLIIKGEAGNNVVGQSPPKPCPALPGLNRAGTGLQQEKIQSLGSSPDFKNIIKSRINICMQNNSQGLKPCPAGSVPWFLQE